MKIFYIKASGYPLAKIEARNPSEAKKIFRQLNGLQKMPAGSVVTSNKESDFLK